MAFDPDIFRVDPASQTGAQRATTRLVRWTFLAFGLLIVPAGLAGAVSQHSFLAAVSSLLGMAMVGLWWLMRPPSPAPSGSARGLRRLCTALNIAVAGLAFLALDEFMASPSYDTSLSTLRPALTAAGAAALVLVARLVLGRRRRAVVSQATAQAPNSSATPATAPPIALRNLNLAPLAPGAGRDLLLRPERARLRAWQRRSTAGAVPLALVVGARAATTGTVGLLVIAATVAVALPLALALRELRLRRGMTRLSAETLSVQAWYGRTRTLARSLIERVVLVQAELGSARPQMTPLMLFIGHDGRCLAHVNTAGVAGQDQQAFAAALGVPVQAAEKVVAPEDLRRQFPGSVSWFWQHQVLVVLLGTLVFIVALGAALIAVVPAAPTH
jgi:hypothetical protein